jgi:broad specificity phosphatase PhoE
MTSTIYLIRHGETDWNRDRRIQGQSDTPLNDIGREQARLLGQRLADVPFDLAYASDLSRAIETAKLIVEPRLLDVSTDIGLRERAFGEWEGGTAEDVSREYPERWAAWHSGARDVPPPGGETQVELELRVTRALDNIIAANHGGTLLVVSHGGAIQATLCSWFGVDVRGMANCTGYIVDVAGGERRLGGQI